MPLAAFLPIALALAQFAPKLIGMLAGPKAEETAEEVVNIATAVTGEMDPERALEKIKAGGEMQLAFQAQANEFALKRMEIELQDVKDARKREQEVVRITGGKDYNLYILAWLVVLGFFTLTALLFKYKVEGNEVVLVLFGALAQGFGMVLAYFFGSSRGSAEKSRIMAASNTKTK